MHPSNRTYPAMSVWQYGSSGGWCEAKATLLQEHFWQRAKSGGAKHHNHWPGNIRTACLKYLLERWEQGMWMEEPSQTLTRLLERNCTAARARQNGDHRDRWSRKVIIFDGKFYLSFTRFCLLFDGKRVSVTETNILLLTICMILTMIRISILKTKYIWFHFPDFKDFALFVANFVVVIYALSRKV